MRVGLMGWVPDDHGVCRSSVPAGSRARVAVEPAHEHPGLPRVRVGEGATQAVMGAGRRDARLMLVGEQPGDREDIEGRPFVGPAGRVLDRGLELAGIDREAVYVTNAVKHFRYKARGKRRIHQTPERAHVTACRPWLDAEIALIRPRVLVCLGATAARGLLGSQIRIGRDRGQLIESELAQLSSRSLSTPRRSCASTMTSSARRRWSSSPATSGMRPRGSTTSAERPTCHQRYPASPVRIRRHASPSHLWPMCRSPAGKCDAMGIDQMRVVVTGATGTSAPVSVGAGGRAQRSPRLSAWPTRPERARASDVRER